MPNLPTPPLPLLITGVAGVAGYNALLHFRRTDNWPIKGEGILACDGDDLIRRAYDTEIRKGYRFFSYGDAIQNLY